MSDELSKKAGYLKLEEVSYMPLYIAGIIIGILFIYMIYLIVQRSSPKIHKHDITVIQQIKNTRDDNRVMSSHNYTTTPTVSTKSKQSGVITPRSGSNTTKPATGPPTKPQTVAQTVEQHQQIINASLPNSLHIPLVKNVPPVSSFSNLINQQSVAFPAVNSDIVMNKLAHKIDIPVGN